MSADAGGQGELRARIPEGLMPRVAGRPGRWWWGPVGIGALSALFALAIGGRLAVTALGLVVALTVAAWLSGRVGGALSGVVLGATNVIGHYEGFGPPAATDSLGTALLVAALLAGFGALVGLVAQRQRALIDDLRSWVRHQTELEARGRSVMEAAVDAIVIMDRGGAIIEFNAAAKQMFGRGHDDVVGLEMAEVIIPERFRAAHREGLERYLTTGEGPVIGGTVEVVGLHADGTEIPVDLSISAVDSPEHGTIFAGHMHDLREAHRVRDEFDQAREEAERASRAKDEFLSRMSHELRTPLNAIVGFAQLIEPERLEPDDRRSLGQIERAGDLLDRLIDDALDISRIEAGELGMELEAIDPCVAAEAALSMIEPMATESGVEIETEKCARPGLVLADSRRVSQVVLNLLSNAVKFNDPGGRVGITVDHQADRNEVTIAVSDDGPGISAELYERLFEPFERLGVSDHHVRGTGLGLALSRSLAEAMGGTITVESQVGEGSTFTLSLPSTDERQASNEFRPEAPITALDLSGPVLYIEDNRTNTELVSRLVRDRLGSEFRSAPDGRSGIKSAQDQPRPCVVLLDLDLPDIPGPEVLAALRADGRTAGIPIVIVSADATQRRIDELIAAGADAYLTKPIRLAGLSETLRSIVGLGSSS